MKNRDPIFVSFSAALIILFSIVVRRLAISSQSTDVAEAMPTLEGDKAKQYLDQHRLGRSLSQVLETARYIANRVDRPTGDRESSAFEARNSEKNFAAYFSADGVNLLARGEGREFSLSLRLKSIGRGTDQSPIGKKQCVVNSTTVSSAHEVAPAIFIFHSGGEGVPSPDLCGGQLELFKKRDLI